MQIMKVWGYADYENLTKSFHSQIKTVFLKPKLNFVICFLYTKLKIK